MKKQQIYLLLAVSIVFYFTSLLIFKFDINFTYRWLILYFSLFPLLLIVGLWIFTLIPYKRILASISIYGLFAIFLFAVISRFIFLVDYPFVSVGDELRDGGLNALELTTGQIKNIFGYGRYDAHGLIIPTITSAFYKIFGGSVLVYRFPAALVSVLDIVFFYLLLSLLTKNKIASFLGAMVLISLPLHLFYSRTEIVVILSSLFSTLILFGLFVFIRRGMRNIFDYVFLGALLGFSFNLHASIKAFGLITFAIIILMIFYRWFSGELKINQFVIKLLLLVIFLFVGFGPRLLNTPSLSLFFHTSRIPLATEKHVDKNSYDIKGIRDKYLKSLLVWVSKPTSSWYPDHKPIFSPPLFLLMILGIIVGLARKNLYLIAVLCIALILHLSNSALTDILNGDHRLAPLYPVGALFVGVGVTFLISKIKLRIPQYALVFALFMFLFYQAILFFILQPSNKNKDIGDYLSMHTIYFIKANNDLYKTNNLIFLVSPFNYQKLNYLHYKEQYMFFFPKANIVIEKSETVGDNEIYIKNNNYDYLGKSYIIKCSGKDYYCPIDYKNNIVIHY